MGLKKVPPVGGTPQRLAALPVPSAGKLAAVSPRATSPTAITRERKLMVLVLGVAVSLYCVRAVVL